jgi:hypothetical protein
MKVKPCSRCGSLGIIIERRPNEILILECHECVDKPPEINSTESVFKRVYEQGRLAGLEEAADSADILLLEEIEDILGQSKKNYRYSKNVARHIRAKIAEEEKK